MTTTLDPIPDELLAELEAAVARGAALLDAHEPGWDAVVDTATLDLADCHECVLGQVFMARWRHDYDRWSNPFDLGIDALVPAARSLERLVESGFTLPTSLRGWVHAGSPYRVGDRVRIAWDALGDAWGKLLADRGRMT